MSPLGEEVLAWESIYQPPPPPPEHGGNPMFSGSFGAVMKKFRRGCNRLEPRKKKKTILFARKKEVARGGGDPLRGGKKTSDGKVLK